MPALVVASAGKPASTKMRAEPASQALGSTSRGPFVWSFASVTALSRLGCIGADPLGLPARRLPLAGVPEAVAHRDVGLNVVVLLEEETLPVDQELDLGRQPPARERCVLVEARLGGPRRILPRGREHPHEHEPLLVHPELPRVQVTRLRAHDPDRPSLPGRPGAASGPPASARRAGRTHRTRAPAAGG